MDSDVWDIEQARSAYNIAHWSNGYFDVGRNGNLIVCPKADSRLGAIDLFKLTEEIKGQGLSPPVLVRFVDILHHRICLAFEIARLPHHHVPDSVLFDERIHCGERLGPCLNYRQRERHASLIVGDRDSDALGAVIDAEVFH